MNRRHALWNCAPAWCRQAEQHDTTALGKRRGSADETGDKACGSQQRAQASTALGIADASA
jgi:hypothetical protein